LLERMKRLVYHLRATPKMESENGQSTVPVMATRRLELVGDQPVYQAVPEDYVLASLLFRALDESDGRQLEFVLKCYLPIHIYHDSESEDTVFFEPLALASEVLTPISLVDLTDAMKRVSSSTDGASLTDALKGLLGALAQIAPSAPITLPGLVSGDLAVSISKILDWPTADGLEPNAVLLPGVIPDDDLAGGAKQILDASLRNAQLRDSLEALLQLVQENVGTTSRVTDNGIRVRLAKLDERIAKLESEVENLTSRLEASKKSKTSVGSSAVHEIQGHLAARKTALKRDRDQRGSLLAEQRSSIDGLLRQSQAAKDDIDRILGLLKDQRVWLEHTVVQCRRSGCCVDARALIPFVVFGYSSKGVLKTVFCPPSKLLPEGSRAAKHKGFRNPLEAAFGSFDDLSRMLESRVDSDIGLLKYLRSSSEKFNLLSLRNTRSMLLEGAKLLVADGLLKESGAAELTAVVDRFPEQAPVKGRVKSVPALVVDESALVRVRFVVTDDQGHPVDGASIAIGAVEARTDSKGIAEAHIPKSRYEVAVSADGFRDKMLEFSLKSAADVAVPIVLNRLTREELLDMTLESLVERAKRIDEIRDKLGQIFEKEGDTLLSVPAYRSALVELLTDLGYEPEPWISQATQKRGMVGRLLRGDNRHDGIRRDILRLAEESRSSGGVMLFSELLYRLDKFGWHTSPDEIVKVIDAMTREGLLHGMTSASEGTRIVSFIPVSLTGDPGQVLELAATRDGRLSIEDIVVGLGWTDSRARSALDLLVENGVTKVQKSFSKSTTYWFPGLRKKK